MLDFGFTEEGCELYGYPDREQLANGQGWTFVQDFSGKNRTLASDAPHPINATNQTGGKAVIRFDGTASPLKNNSVFTVRCGFIVAKANGATFDGYQGFVSDLQNLGILVGDNATANFFDFKHDLYEFRSNERIYPSASSPAPMDEFRLIFFRFHIPITVNGIQLGQDRNLADHRLDGDIAFFALFSRDFREAEIRARSEELRAGFGLSPFLDVYPYREDKDSDGVGGAEALFFKPRRGAQISKVLIPFQERFNLKFTDRETAEVRAMIAFYQSHYAGRKPFIWRSYKGKPPEDRLGYFDSPYSISGALHKWTYSFAFVADPDASVIVTPPVTPPVATRHFLINGDRYTVNGNPLSI